MSNIESQYSIITLNGYTNYGNRLQLFALHKALSSIGIESQIYWLKNYKRIIKEILWYYTPLRIAHKKDIKLRRFTSKHIAKETHNVPSVAIVGSDQVWNPLFIKDKPYLLDAQKAKTKISYAASVGFDTLTDNQKKLFARELKLYKAISVREKSAQKILQPLTQKKVEVVLDPTLLLDENEYERIEKKPKDIKDKEKFILCYILGNREYQKVIEKYAKEKNLRIILFSDKKGSDYGIEEFLYIIHHAEAVFTDSFHACVFSFIFERPFIVFKRSGEADYMYTRIRNLIDTFGFKKQEYNGESISKNNLTVDYTEAKKLLKLEQKKSMQFLKKALGKTDEN